MGLSWTYNRLFYEIKKKSGILKKQFKHIKLTNHAFIRKHINDKSIKNENDLYEYIKSTSQHFFFSVENLAEIRSGIKSLYSDKKEKEIIKKADNITENIFEYFSKDLVSYDVINWHYSPFINKQSPKDKHWIDISDLNSDFGDIKFIWELSRFAFVYDLVRAYTLTQDDKYVVKYWELIEDWIENNPLEYGVNYKCGQEMSIRMMAWLFGLYAFLNHKETTPSRATTLLKTIYQHAEHVEKHFNFALKIVRNNHAISEAYGLYTIGLLFPIFDKYNICKNTGKKYLEKEGLRQIKLDGSYIQHSMNYHRLVIQNYTWAIELAKRSQDRFSNSLIGRLLKSVEFLYQHQSISGRLPNYGQNDGALIHPLSSNSYLDYRPQLNAAWFAFTGKRLYEPGEYDESLLWLFREKSLKSEIDAIQKISKKFPNGGYYTFRNRNQFGMIRCTTYKTRPVQADMLHFDLWINDFNVFADAGTYSYNTSSNIKNYFLGTASHNTIMINNKSQMTKGSRFMWLNWTKSQVNKYVTKPNYMIFEGEHYNYKPLIHKRGILHNRDSWVIVDDIFGKFTETNTEMQLSWLLGTKINSLDNEMGWNITVDGSKYNLLINVSADKKEEIYKGSLKPFKG